MQTDCNFVVYDYVYKPILILNTIGKGSNQYHTELNHNRSLN